MTHIVQFSGGIGSWAAAKRVAERHGTENLVLLFCDTLQEDSDLYRFLYEAHANIGGELVQLCEGRDVWELFDDEGFIAGPHRAVCTRMLKQEMADRYITDHYTPDNCIRYVGFDVFEIHRYEGDGKTPGLKKLLEPWRVEAPMCEPPYKSKEQMKRELKEEGIELPRLYRLGFSHNNCGGFCVKAGIGHFVHLLKTLPERYAYHEERERQWRKKWERDFAILEWRSGPFKGQPMTLEALRLHVESGGQCDLFDIGGCNCFAA